MRSVPRRDGSWASFSLLLAGCGSEARPLDGGAREIDSAMALCVAPSTPGLVGAPCRCTTDCTQGLRCSDEASNGYPRGACGRSCTRDDQCPGGTCVIRKGTEGFCKALCDASGECARAALCSPAVHACFPYCQADSDCESGRCNHWSGACLQRDQEPTGRLTDEPCTQFSDCRSEVCGPQMSCITPCSPVRQGCPDGEVCLASIVSGTYGFCAQRCANSAECRGRGLSCLALRGMPGVRACQ